MSMLALVSGILARAPERRISKAGRPYVTTAVRVVDGGASIWWNIVAFEGDICVELTGLGVGDALSVTGAMRAEVWTPDGGQARVNLSLVAAKIVTPRRAGRKAKPRPAGQEQTCASHIDESGAGAELDDDVPF